MNTSPSEISDMKWLPRTYSASAICELRELDIQVRGRISSLVQAINNVTSRPLPYIIDGNTQKVIPDKKYASRIINFMRPVYDLRVKMQKHPEVYEKELEIFNLTLISFYEICAEDVVRGRELFGEQARKAIKTEEEK